MNSRDTKAYVQVVSDPSKVTPSNPNGVGVGTNIDLTMPGAYISVIQLLSEGIHQWSEVAKAQSSGKIAQNIVMPNGAPAIMN